VQIGALTSIFPIMYGVSKFASGVLGSRTSPQLLLAGGLMATAVMNLAFGFSTSMLWFAAFWSLNGMLQGLGAPGCARVLTSWFAAKERGTYWGMWNIAHNMGGFAAPLLAGTAAKLYGWKWGEPPAAAAFARQSRALSAVSRGFGEGAPRGASRQSLQNSGRRLEI
jgi:sugar phosphate permease